MLELNKELKWAISAQIVVEGKAKIKYKRGELENFINEIESCFTDPKQIGEAMMVLNYIVMERKVKVENGEILLFSEKFPKGKVGPSWIIKGNPELCNLLARLI